MTWAQCAYAGGAAYMGNGSVCESNSCPTSDVDGGPSSPKKLQLQVVPNPGSGEVAIRCMVPTRTPAALELFDASGRMVRRLYDGDLPAGEIPVSWDGRDDAGRGLPAGLYFARIRIPGEVVTTKIIWTR